MKESEIVEALRKENEEFRKVEEEHRELDGKITEMDKNKYLSTEEELERKKLQKKKLAMKDRMAEFIREYKNAVAS
ncbi:MAG: YdcH family protein [Nitrospirota bacterium]|nr:MAG: YdcH family protein [Nitrospirota bacterium]